MREKIPITLEIEKVSKHISHFDFEEVADDLFGDMREMTPEESEAHSRYISSISTSTGVNIWDILDKADNVMNPQ